MIGTRRHNSIGSQRIRLVIYNGTDSEGDYYIIGNGTSPLSRDNKQFFHMFVTYTVHIIHVH